jgi:hypothetical protein
MSDVECAEGCKSRENEIKNKEGHEGGREQGELMSCAGCAVR